MFVGNTPLLIRCRRTDKALHLQTFAYEIADSFGTGWTPSSLQDLSLERCLLREPVEIWGPHGFHEIKCLYRRRLYENESLQRIMGTFGVLDCTADMTIRTDQTKEVEDLSVGECLSGKPMLNITEAQSFPMTSYLIGVCKRSLLACMRNALAAGYMLARMKSIISEVDFEEKWLLEFEKSQQTPKQVTSIHCIGFSNEQVQTLDVDSPDGSYNVQPGTLLVGFRY